MRPQEYCTSSGISFCLASFFRLHVFLPCIFQAKPVCESAEHTLTVRKKTEFGLFLIVYKGPDFEFFVEGDKH
jgi:hypothetical protein